MAETFTVNYNWTKPEIGASIDNWGGYLNGDLDGIDSTVHGIDTTAVRDAPNDGTLYGRKSAAWAHLTHNDITDWASAAAPPVVVQDTAPSSPQPGALWWDSVGGQLYCWVQDANSSQWVIAVNIAAALPPASTTVLGGVKVDGTTIKAAGDGTISTTVVPMGDNRLINGDMRIDQRNNGASGTASGYTVDRWQFGTGVVGKITWQQGPSGLLPFPKCITCLTSVAYTPSAGDVFRLSQVIEADMVSDFAWGAAGAQPVTLSFWAYCSLTGTFGGAINNVAGTRSYPFTFSIPSVSTWAKIIVNIPGDTVGAWVMSGNAGSVQVHFDLGTGSTYRGSVGAWVSANYIGAIGAVSPVTVLNTNFSITGVKLEIGSVSTPFNRQSLAKSMADCQRYYQTIAATIRMNMSGAGQSMYHTVSWAQMRASPTTALITAGSRSNANSITLGSGQPNSGSFSCSSVAAGDMYVFGDLWSLSAEL